MMIQLFLFLAMAAPGLANPTECLSEVDPSTDYFPHKVSAEHSQYWSVEYASTYKIAKNYANNKTYVLHQCGTEPPTDIEADEIVAIPLTSVGITVTPMISFLEQLGALHYVDYYLTEVEYISSPCFLEQVLSGNVSVTPTSGHVIDEDNGNLEGGDRVNATDEVLAATLFGDGYQPTLPFAHTIEFQHYLESTNEAIFEWIKFFAVFFNLEETANAVTQSASDRYRCVEDMASASTADAPPTVALWASYNTYCEGWQLGDCPNYYCEIAEKCSTTLMTDGVGSIDSGVCGNLMTVEEFVAYGKDAEIWFYDNFEWDETYAANKDLLDTMKAVQNGQVYDYKGSGQNAWFQERVAEYYDVLQDFCHTVGAAPSLDRPSWFRNVFSEGVGSPGACIDGMRNDNLPFSFDFAAQCELPGRVSSTSSAAMMGVVSAAVLTILCAVC